MVRLRDMKGDQYVFYPDERMVVGKRTGIEYHMGTKVWIRVKNTNLARRTIDFEFVE